MTLIVWGEGAKYPGIPFCEVTVEAFEFNGHLYTYVSLTYEITFVEPYQIEG